MGNADTFAPPQLEFPRERCCLNKFSQILLKGTKEQKQTQREGENRSSVPVILQSTGCVWWHAWSPTPSPSSSARSRCKRAPRSLPYPRCQQLFALIKVRSARSRAQPCAANVHSPDSAGGKGKRHCRAHMLLFIELCLPVTHLLLLLRQAFSSQNTSIFLRQPQFLRYMQYLKLINKINA